MTHDDERLQAWEREAIAWFLHGKGAAKGDGKGDVSGAGKGSGLGPPMKGDGKGKKGPPEASSLSRPLASVPRTSMPPPEPSAPPRKAAAPIILQISGQELLPWTSPWSGFCLVFLGFAFLAFFFLICCLLLLRCSHGQLLPAQVASIQVWVVQAFLHRSEGSGQICFQS